jgi:sporulation protein YlmC with PRC-barrel domain
MIASDLLDAPVLDADGTHVGFVVDLRLVLDGTPDGPLARPRLHGLVVSPRSRSSFLGYERSAVSQPWPVAQLVRRRHRGTFLVHWSDVASVPGSQEVADPRRQAAVVLARGVTRYDARL